MRPDEALVSRSSSSAVRKWWSKHLDPGRTLSGLHQCCHLGVIDSAHLVLVEEVDDLGVMANKAKPVALTARTRSASWRPLRIVTRWGRLASAEPLVAAAGGADQGAGMASVSMK